MSVFNVVNYKHGGGGQIVNVIFTATADNLSGTPKIFCLARLAGTMIYNYSSPAYVYTQGSCSNHDISIPTLVQIGPPSSAQNITAMQQDKCSILIQWSPPYLLPGLSVSYKVDINGEEIDVFTTYYEYYPMKLTNASYVVIIEPFNNSIIGEANDIDVLYETGLHNAF